jgi:hypothetical protein
MSRYRRSSMRHLLPIAILLAFGVTGCQPQQPIDAQLTAQIMNQIFQQVSGSPTVFKAATDLQDAIANGDRRFLTVDGTAFGAEYRPDVVSRFGTRTLTEPPKIVAVAYPSTGSASNARPIITPLPIDSHFYVRNYNRLLLHYLEIHHEIPATEPATGPIPRQTNSDPGTRR